MHPTTTTPHIFVSEPMLVGNERDYLLQCVEEKRLSAGSFVLGFEEAIRTYHRSEFALACVNGTTALHLAMLACGLKPGDEVIVPSLTYIATANAVAYCGATPVFAEIDARTWNLDPEDVERKITKRTVGIIPVHLFGNPCDMQRLQEIALRYRLWLVEDAAEALGGKYGSHPCGTMSDVGIFSFYGNKVLTCGEGGALITNSQTKADRIRLYRGQGQSFTQRYYHTVVGYNYRMTNLQAAVGLAQFERLNWHQFKRREVFVAYTEAFHTIPELQPQRLLDHAQHAYWMYAVLLPSHERRERLARRLAEVGIETRPFFMPIHRMPMYASRTTRSLLITEDVASRGLMLPTHAGLRESDLSAVIHAVLGYL